MGSGHSGSNLLLAVRSISQEKKKKKTAEAPNEEFFQKIEGLVCKASAV